MSDLHSSKANIPQGDKKDIVNELGINSFADMTDIVNGNEGD